MLARPSFYAPFGATVALLALYLAWSRTPAAFAAIALGAALAVAWRSHALPPMPAWGPLAVIGAIAAAGLALRILLVVSVWRRERTIRSRATPA